MRLFFSQIDDLSSSMSFNLKDLLLCNLLCNGLGSNETWRVLFTLDAQQCRLGEMTMTFSIT